MDSLRPRRPEPPAAIANLVDLWLHDKAAETQRAYRRDVDDFIAIADVRDLRAISLGDLHQYEDELRARNRAPASIRRGVNALKSLLTFAHRTGAIGMNVGAVKKAPRVDDDPDARALPEESVYRLVMAATSERSAMLIRMLYYPAARVGELSRLCWGDIRPRGERGVVKLRGKGDRTRFVILPAWLYVRMIQLRGSAADSDRVFLSSERAIRRLIERTARRAQLPRGVSPHWLRHAHCSHALDRGAPAHLVRSTAGHKSLATTGRYTHSRPDDSSSLYLGGF